MTGPRDEGGRSPEQVKKDLATDGTAPTAGTASGLAALGSPGGRNIAKGEAGHEDGKPDAIGEAAKPVGLQAEAAFFTRNGSIPGNSVPSPSGPVPASTIGDEATRNAAVEAARAGARSAHQGTRNSRFRITDEAAARLSPAELRAVASDRGYRDVEGGRNAVTRRFLDAQAKDRDLVDPPEGHPLAAQAPIPVPVAPTTGNPLATPSAPGGLETKAGTLRNTDGTAAAAVPPTASAVEKK